MSHLLDPCGLPPKMLRSTRLTDLVNTIDPKLVSAAFGMRNGSEPNSDPTESMSSPAVDVAACGGSTDTPSVVRLPAITN
jgi:hypothetical protein